MANTVTRPTRVEIDLDAFQANVQTFRKMIPEESKLMAVVKADAYGHGAEIVADAAIEAGASVLGVAFVDEAIALRKTGVKAPILILGNSTREAMELAIDYNIEFTVNDEIALNNAIHASEAKSKAANVHIKMDTGMGRLGFLDDASIIRHLQRLNELPNLNIVGLLTHLACADEESTAHAEGQLNKFQKIMTNIEAAVGTRLVFHALNSAGVIQFAHMSLDMVRVGIGLYGLSPSPFLKDKVALQPVLSFKTEIVQLKEVAPGTTISYGATYTSAKQMKVATLPVGYADGYNRLLSNNGEVLVKGQRVPIIGRVCMDQMMIDVSQLSDIGVGEEVVLYGKQLGEEISVDEIAAKLNTINYEVCCAINCRVPRMYFKGDKLVNALNRLIEKNR